MKMDGSLRLERKACGGCGEDASIINQTESFKVKRGSNVANKLLKSVFTVYPAGMG